MTIASPGSEGLGGDLNTLREHNLRSVLEALLLQREGMTQSEIVEHTKLSRSTVSTLVGALVDVLVPEEELDSERGRPAKRWRVKPDAAYSIGVDIGHSHVSVAATDVFGQLAGAPLTVSVARVFERPHHVMRTAAELVESYLRQMQMPCGRIAAVAIGLPGAVDASSGIMTDNTAHLWAGMDVRDEVRKRWPHETVPKLLADNDANLGALAEHRFGAGRGVRSLMYVKWSTGIGSGLVLDDVLWRGHAGVAGEIGHLPARPTQHEAAVLRLPPARTRRRCLDCDQVDCLEQVASGTTVANAVGLPDLSAVVRAALDESSSDSAAARKALKVAAGLIGRAIGPALTLLNVRRVIVGGLVGRELYPLLAEDLSLGLAASALPAARRGVSLEMGALGSTASVWGAAVAGFDAHGIDFLLIAAEQPHEVLAATG